MAPIWKHLRLLYIVGGIFGRKLDLRQMNDQPLVIAQLLADDMLERMAVACVAGEVFSRPRLMP